MGQGLSTSLINASGRIGSSYYVRFIVILLLAAPAAVSLPTLVAAGKINGRHSLSDTILGASKMCRQGSVKKIL